MKTQIGIPFKPGNSGRRKGSKNKTYPFLDDMAAVYKERGGKKGLWEFVGQSKLNLAWFYKAVIEMAQKQLPTKLEHGGEDGNPIRMMFEYGNGNGKQE